MKVLLTGATGFLGSRTLEILIHQDNVDNIIGTGRKLNPTNTIKHPKLDFVLGDLTDTSFINSLTTDVDVIIHTAALSSPWGYYEDFYNANVLTQKNLINSAIAKKVKKFIYVSTPSLYFKLNDRFNIRESDPLPPRFINAYTKTKREAEILLMESCLPYIIIRPRALLGRGDTVIMPRLIRAYDEGKLKIMGNGQNIVDLTSVSNVVDSLILCINAKGKAMNQIYNITNGEPVKLWEKINLVLTMLDKIPPNRRIPFWLVRFVASIMEVKSRMTNNKEPILTIYGVGTLTKSLTMDISKAQKLLNYSPRVSTDEAIEEFVNWYKI